MSSAKRVKLDVPEQEEQPFIPILANELLEDTPLTKVFVGKIQDSKSISEVIKSLNLLLPIPSLAHLKRINKQEVLLVSTSDLAKDKIYEYLETNGFNINLLYTDFREVEVAKIAPKTRLQYEKVQKLWPCNFHPDKYLEKLVTNTLFNSLEINVHKTYMSMAILVATEAKKLHITEYDSGVVVVDPKVNSVVALGYSESHHNPCKHPSMVAIDNVAKTQSGGAWKSYEPIPDSSNLNLNGCHPKLFKILLKKFPHINFGASKFQIDHEQKEPSDPYLCTGYYIYLTREPCIMCAMALIHSRVKRVFYGKSSDNGGLGTLYKIHVIKDLNHHYEVFRTLCENKCELVNEL
ncbi:hypothetical protein ABEB36_003262 [Hypothenemus hampei]|uniref:CMP/dCMP-type deaminase domain-containing protein n=1 Tax=Hypothenemus hampei TaxID=57062 RepID=A0ABD1F8J8_HYPHA